MDLNEVFIGTVVKTNPKTREVDVYIPKLMPAIPETRKEMTVMTNMGQKTINTPYDNDIKYLSSITVASERADEAMPKVGSRVRVRFLDGTITSAFWSKWNPNGDYEVIDEEKYPREFFLTIGSRKLEINADDNIKIVLPDGFSYVINTDEKKKEKTIRLSMNTEFLDRLSFLEKLVGHESFTHTYTDKNGTHSEEFNASGIYSRIETLEKEIDDLKGKLSN